MNDMIRRPGVNSSNFVDRDVISDPYCFVTRLLVSVYSSILLAVLLLLLRITYVALCRKIHSRSSSADAPASKLLQVQHLLMWSGQMCKLNNHHLLLHSSFPDSNNKIMILDTQSSLSSSSSSRSKVDRTQNLILSKEQQQSHYYGNNISNFTFVTIGQPQLLMAPPGGQGQLSPLGGEASFSDYSSFTSVSSDSFSNSLASNSSN